MKLILRAIIIGAKAGLKANVWRGQRPMLAGYLAVRGAKVGEISEKP